MKNQLKTQPSKQLMSQSSQPRRVAAVEVSRCKTCRQKMQTLLSTSAGQTQLRTAAPQTDSQPSLSLSQLMFAKGSSNSNSLVMVDRPMKGMMWRRLSLMHTIFNTRSSVISDWVLYYHIQQMKPIFVFIISNSFLFKSLKY